MGIVSRVSGSYLPFTGSRSNTIGVREDAALGVWRNPASEVVIYRTRSGKVRSKLSEGGAVHKIQNCWIRSAFPIENPRCYRDSKVHLTASTSGEPFISLQYELKGGKGRILDLLGGPQKRVPSDPLLKGLQEALDQAEAAKGKDLVAFIGATGSGKSTIINHLLGVSLVLREGRVYAQDPAKEIAKIGHRPAVAETDFTRVYPKEGDTRAWADCGGFFDTRGLSTELVVAASMKYTLERAKSVKVVLCIPYSSLENEKAGPLIKLVKLVVRDFFKDQATAALALTVLFTKPPFLGPNRMATKETLLRTLGEIKADLARDQRDAARLELVSFLMRENGRHLEVYNPLTPTSRDALQKQLQLLRGVANPSVAFRHVCPPDTLLRLYERVHQIACDAVRYFQERVKDYIEYIASGFNSGSIAHKTVEFIDDLIKRKVRVNVAVTDLGFSTELMLKLAEKYERVSHIFQSKIDEPNNSVTMCFTLQSVKVEGKSEKTTARITQKIIVITPTTGAPKQDIPLAELREKVFSSFSASWSEGISEKRELYAKRSTNVLDEIEVLEQLLQLSGDPAILGSAQIAEYRREKANYEKAVSAQNGPETDNINLFHEAFFGGRFE